MAPDREGSRQGGGRCARARRVRIRGTREHGGSHGLAGVSRPRNRAATQRGAGPRRALRPPPAPDRSRRGRGRAGGGRALARHRGHRDRRPQNAHRELEIELGPSGTPEDLHAVDAELRGYALRPVSASKFERALAILDGHAPTPKPKKKKKALGVRADEPMAEAGRKILRFHFERMLANEDDTRKGEDIEALHHMRVATRRQRAAFRIVSPYFKRKSVDAFRDELRALADHLGAVRDLDVLIESAESYRSSLRREAAAAFTPLVEEWRGRRDDARHALLRHLDSDEYRDFTKRYGEFLSSPGTGVKGGGDPTPHPQNRRHLLPAEVWDHYGRVRAYETVM